MSFYCWKEGNLVLACILQPKASKNEFCQVMENRLKIRVKSAPVEGKANKELQSFLAREFQVAKSAVKITHGETARKKTVMIAQPQQLPNQLDIKPCNA